MSKATDKPKAQAKLLHFGRGGHTLHYMEQGYSNCHCQGYESPESFVKAYHWWSHPKDQLSYHFAGYQFPVDGIPVVDVRAAVETPEGYSWVFKGPLVDVELADGECDCMPQPDPLFAGAVAGNQFGTLLAHHVVTKATQRRGSLDGVSVSEYVSGWRDHGARVGRLYVDGNNARIEWEGGAQ